MIVILCPVVDNVVSYTIWETVRVSYKRQGLLTLREHFGSPPPPFFWGEGGSVLLIFLVFCVASGVSGLAIPDCPSVFSNVYWIKRTIEIYSDLFSPMIRPSYITPWDSKKIFPVKDFDLYLSVIQLLQEILYNYAVVGKVVVEIEKHSIVNLKIVQCK